MAVVPRKQKQKTTYRVAAYVKDKMQFEPALTDKHEAKRLEKRRKREVKAGTYQRPRAAARFVFSRTLSVLRRAHEPERQERAAPSGVLCAVIQWFAEKPMDEVEPPDFLRLVKEIRAKRKIIGDLEFRAVG